jgi:hypothetical protein
MIGTSAAKKSIRLASLELEQRFELCSHIVNHPGWGFACKSRAALLPRGAAQLVGLHDTPYFVTIRYRNMKAPIAVATCYRARDAAAGKLVEGARRKHERWPTSGLFVANRLQEVEPNDIP